MRWDEMFAEASAKHTADQLMRPKSLAPADVGTWDNFASGAGNYLMRSFFAEPARAASMVLGAVPVALQATIDAVDPGGRVNDKRLDDAYFKFHDDVFQRAVDYWTPKPNTVGKAGEIVGQLAGGVGLFALSPGLAVANAQLNTSIDLVRSGVDAGPALVAGDIAGIGTALGVAAPFFGSTLARKAASGAGVNVLQGAATAAATRGVLQAAGAEKQAQQFDPFDITSRSLDVLMGAAFGGVAHIQERAGLRRLEFDGDQRAALLTLNHARQLEQTAHADSTPQELTAHVTQVQRAVEQLLRGEPVNAADTPVRIPDAPPELAADLAVEPAAPEIVRPPMIADAMPVADEATGVAPDAAAKPADPTAVAAARAVALQPDLMIDTGLVNSDGSPERLSAADFLARAELEVQQTARTDANLFRTAAECLLGAI